MVVIFMVFLPLSLTANLVASRTIPDWPLVARVVLVTTVMTPLMTYVFLPWMTRRMSWWLHR
jgi:antibiotic biosynthesis monooxygenase (ABM) superfamily enzyme